MAWIRRVRTASGATAGEIAEYTGGRRRIVAHVGSAHTEAELGVLLERARGLLGDAGQEVLDLGVEATPRKTGMVTSAPVEGALFTSTERPAERERVSAPRVVATSSRMLFDV